MTEPKEQQEPSMEEILSSIRRIIADEETDGERADAAEAKADEEAESPESEEETDDSDDVLELTQVVRESGEVVDLSLAAAERNEPIEKREPEESADTGPQQGFGGAAAHADQQSESISGDPPSSDQPRTNPFQAAQPRGEHTDQPPVSSIRDDGMDKHGTAMPMNEKGSESLISEHALGAASGAFAKLGQAVQRTPPELAIADDSGRTIEQFVEDMIRPMLREWLDENMPPLVERIVQKEVQKIVRRAEID